ncbi:MAG: 2'-5' RNA ligase family protein, partial [Bacteroidales bacterium]
PHLTIGRIKFIKHKDRLKNLVLENEDKFFDRLRISELIYFESVLHPQGPEYIPIEKYKL